MEKSKLIQLIMKGKFTMKYLNDYRNCKQIEELLRDRLKELERIDRSFDPSMLSDELLRNFSNRLLDAREYLSELDMGIALLPHEQLPDEELLRKSRNPMGYAVMLSVRIIELAYQRNDREVYALFDMLYDTNKLLSEAYAVMNKVFQCCFFQYKYECVNRRSI